MRARLFALALCLVASSSAIARADGKQACLTAYVDGQEMRKSGKLRRASDHFLLCSQTTCPDLARADCSRWLSEVNATMATVVLDIRDGAGHRVTQARVSVDGDVVATALDGAPLPLDPGAHTLRVESAGSPPVEQVVVLKTGEKDHVVRLDVGVSPDASPVASGTSTSSRPIPIVTYVFAAVSVVSLASFAGFGSAGRSAENDLASCKPFCATSDVDAVRSKYLVANVSLGVGVVALGAAAYFFFTRPSVPETASHPLSVDVALARHDGSLVVRWTQ